MKDSDYSERFPKVRIGKQGRAGESRITRVSEKSNKLFYELYLFSTEI